MFIMNIIFSVLFPTTDISSDIYLSHQTVNFIGDNEVLRGCRTCFHKDKRDMLENRNKGCNTCFLFLPKFVVNNDGSWLEHDFKYSKDNEFLYRISYPTIYCYNTILDKALELESNSEQCNESFRERLSYSDDCENSISLESNDD